MWMLFIRIVALPLKLRKVHLQLADSKQPDDKQNLTLIIGVCTDALMSALMSVLSEASTSKLTFLTFDLGTV